MREIRGSTRRAGKVKQRIISGNTMECATSIMFLKDRMLIVITIACWAMVSITTAYAEGLSWFEAEDGRVLLSLEAGGEWVLEVPAGVRGGLF